MKANELMIGYWVTAKKWREKPFQLTRINDGNKFFYGKNGDIYFGPFLIEELEPVPITLEILKKNGFKNDFYEEESIADYHKIRLEGYSIKHNIGKIGGYLITWCNGSVNVTTELHGCVQKDISYVHELQNAMRLCEIEYEIAL